MGTRKLDFQREILFFLVMIHLFYSLKVNKQLISDSLRSLNEILRFYMILPSIYCFPFPNLTKKILFVFSTNVCFKFQTNFLIINCFFLALSYIVKNDFFRMFNCPRE